MRSMSDFIKEDTPKYNKFMLEGYGYNKMKTAYEYIDEFFKFACENKTKTHLKYLGCRKVSPQEEIKLMYNVKSKYVYDCSLSYTYLVEYVFQYADEPTVRKYYFYLPYFEKGNVFQISGSKFVVMSMLANKVISIGDNVIFVNIHTSKYNVYRVFHSVVVNGVYQRVPVIISSLYKNQSKKLEDTTKAYTIIFHYLLCVYGYTKTTEMLLGFTPEVTYGENKKSNYVNVTTTGQAPKGYIKPKTLYQGTNMYFSCPQEKYNEDVKYVIGNLMYLIDNFPDIITIEELDNTLLWTKLLGEIIHSGKHQLSYIMEKMNAHFSDICSSLDVHTIEKLKDVGYDNILTTLDLLYLIFKNYNNWIMSDEVRSIYNNKCYETETYVLNPITSNFVRAMLDLSKEELRNNKEPLDSKTVTKIMKVYMRERSIFKLKSQSSSKLILNAIEYSGDHLYFKNTAMVSEQESNPVNVKKQENSPVEKKKLSASMITVGNILGLPKKNPTPVVRMNPYVNVDYKTGTVLAHPYYNNIISITEKYLSNFVDFDTVKNQISELENADSEEENDNSEDTEDYSDTDIDTEDMDE